MGVINSSVPRREGSLHRAISLERPGRHVLRSITCLDDDEALAFVEARISAERRAEVEGHLAACAQCARLLLAMAGSHPGVSVDPSSPTQEEDGFTLELVESGRYEIGAEIARGGMGRVVSAWDRRHQRYVAIKFLLRGGVELERRFLREAKLTARLQHPSILPLYEAGRWPDGQPFLAVKLVEGRSLAQAIADATEFQDRLGLLAQLLAACDALAYAHRHGVVHRDFKPSNVLIGDLGETVVIDWGLAKDLRSARERDVGDGDPAVSSPTDNPLTETGRALGTPCYMAPEQARGEAVDASADVYALGAVLYHLLVGEPPYVGASSREIVARVLAGPPVPLRHRSPEVPADLASIVSKAMARAPAERYATALEMRLDLASFASGRRVAAHAYSAAELVGRWMARRRGIVAATLLFTLGLAATMMLDARRVVRERDRADEQRRLALDLQRAADTRRDAAEQLVEYVLDDLHQQLNTLGRLDLLESAGAELERYYQSLSTLADSPSSLARRARGLGVLSQASTLKHDYADAREQEVAASELLERALALAPGDHAVRARLVESQLRLARACEQLNDIDAAMAADHRAVDEASALASDAPEAQRLRVRAQRDLAELLGGHGEPIAALEAERTLRDLLEAAVRERPDDTALKDQLGDTWISVGVAAGFVELDNEMLASERAALNVYDDLAAHDPKNAQFQMQRSLAMQLIAGAQLSLGEPADGLEWERRSIAIRQELIARDPKNIDWQTQLGYSVQGEAWALRDLGRAREAVAVAVTLVEHARGVAAKSPGDVRSRADVGRALMELAQSELAAGDDRAALRTADQLATLTEDLLRGDPKRTSTRYFLAVSRLLASRANLHLGQPRNALQVAHHGLALAEDLVRSVRGDDSLLLLQARLQAQLGDSLAATGASEDGCEALRHAIVEFDHLWQEGHNRAEWLVGGPQASRALATLLHRRGDDAGAARTLQATAAQLDRFESERHVPPALRPEVAALRADLARLTARRDPSVRTP